MLRLRVRVDLPDGFDFLGQRTLLPGSVALGLPNVSFGPSRLFLKMVHL